MCRPYEIRGAAGADGPGGLRAILPASGGVALVVISMILTFIAGPIPSGFAARRDPVEALRTE